jgi:creatinine amidohydrolase
VVVIRVVLTAAATVGVNNRVGLCRDWRGQRWVMSWTASRMKGCAVAMLLCMATAGATVQAAGSVQLEDLTWTELRTRVAAGATTALVPLGGTEQNGPHMALGKHNVRVRFLATRIAQQLGNAIVAPVLAYVPEGAINPPTQHMRWPGTLTIPDAAFEALLQGTARSLRSHGFCHVFLLGDHGGYRQSLDRVAAVINREWAGSACRVHALPEYYRAASAEHAQALKARGFAAEEIGTHAGLADTSLMLAIDPSLVRSEAMSGKLKDSGVSGDASRASAELGQLGVDLIVRNSVAAIRASTKAQP